ncbi:zinc-ribbon domain containing protein [Desulfonema magnum]|uniref:Zinc-ribbon domain-containing protein n=1 Tax=Desulfonema magnum TaxID=45655 RepID=A0A975BJR8_9BACT|nr:zinc-ribbon domain containing protein [Desulfonema magnum]QTA86601.1 putative zinc-ribbon domain-containing protein [Desulfonema magnum]
MEDKVIYCIQCDEPFNFSISEQNYFAAKGFDEPTRCSECRKKKRSAGNGFQGKRKKKYNKKIHHNDEWDE